MRIYVSAVTLVCCLVSAAASVAPAPCNLIDRETLAAFALGDAVARPEHKTVPATAQSPEQHVEMGTTTPCVGSAPSLTVMLLPLPGKNVAAKPV